MSRAKSILPPLAIVVARSLTPYEWGIFSGFLGLSLALGILVTQTMVYAGAWSPIEFQFLRARLWRSDSARGSSVQVYAQSMHEADEGAGDAGADAGLEVALDALAGRGRQHPVLGRHPALAGIAQELRHTLLDAGGPPLPLFRTGEGEHLMNSVVRQIARNDGVELRNVNRRGRRDVGLVHVDDAELVGHRLDELECSGPSQVARQLDARPDVVPVRGR